MPPRRDRNQAPDEALAGGLEPPTCGLEVRCSIRLSYASPRPAESTGSLHAPGRIRTCDLRFRKPLLYPLSYEGLNSIISSIPEGLRPCLDAVFVEVSKRFRAASGIVSSTSYALSPVARWAQWDLLMTDILTRIVQDKKAEIARSQARVPTDELKRRAADMAPPRNFFKSLTRPKDELRVIAEIKRASPSAGMIREDFDPVSLAVAYCEHGAAAISCLTDAKYFQGSLDYIAQIKRAVPLPVLRKDFIIDPYQMYEARAAGADAVLLIGECLDEPRLIDLLILATELKMTTLVEVHSVDNLLKVRPHIGFPHPSYTLLGINNRDLKTMETDVTHTLRLCEMVEDTSILVSESGIRTRADVERLEAAGVRRILVGEHLMRQRDVGAALRELMGNG